MFCFITGIVFMKKNSQMLCLEGKLSLGLSLVDNKGNFKNKPLTAKGYSYGLKAIF